MLLFNNLMQEQGRALVASRLAFVGLRRVNAVVMCALLGLALVWVWLRSATREHARRFARNAALHGSRASYLWLLAQRATDAAPWLSVFIAFVGAIAGFLLRNYVPWWWGLVLAFVAASLAPAWAESTIGRFSKR